MTSSLGIAATTAVLRQMLQNAIPTANLVGLLGNVTVSALPPDKIDVANETSRLNLFMYQVRPNAGWSNSEAPSHSVVGRRLTNPPLALDLSYMLSAYGAKDFFSEILLGYGALVVHQTRVLTRDLVQQTFSGGALPPDLALLANCGLDAQEQLVSLSIEPMTIDDLSRLWQVFGEKYRPSVAFQAHVVLLRGDDAAAASGPPVQRARLATTTSIHPTITSVEPGNIVFAAGVSISVVGTGLLVAGARAAFGSGETDGAAPGSTPFRVGVTLPATLRAGVNTVRMQLPSIFEGDVRGGPESNVAPFILRPAFALDGGGNPDITVSAPVLVGTLASTTVTVRLTPPIGRDQDVTLLLNEQGVAAGAVPHTYTVSAPSRRDDPNETTDTIAVDVDTVHRARYLMRLRVDGAETDLLMTGGVYDRPSLDLS
jgi:Pvc16 N-terminal domain